ncbi:MAG: hypothetical protein AB7P69_07840 [Candidatus Binatia bacterium]
MPFDLTTWKATVRERLTNWRQRMQGFGVNSVYGSLCAMTLWPVVQAATGEDISAGMALGGVLSSVGTNLVANCIQGWKDEADAARDIEAELSNPAFHTELDAIL